MDGLFHGSKTLKKMNDLGVHPFLETSICSLPHFAVAFAVFFLIPIVYSGFNMVITHEPNKTLTLEDCNSSCPRLEHTWTKVPFDPTLNNQKPLEVNGV